MSDENEIDDDLIGDMQYPYVPPNEFKAPPPEIRGRMIVRNKEGKLKCDNLDAIPKILELEKLRADKGLPPMLSEDEINDLKEKIR